MRHCVDLKESVSTSKLVYTRTTVNNKFIIECLSDMILIKFTAVEKRPVKKEHETGKLNGNK